jgi:hypothetical protein
VSSHIKSGKSAFIGGCIATTFGLDGDTLGVNSTNPDGHAVIHFDTEQSPSDHHAVITTALSRVGITQEAEWLRSYRIADIPTAQRFDLLEHELREGRKAHGGIHSVLLDGSVDYLRDPNDSDEAFAAVERLHMLAVEYSTTILCVIHINPGSVDGKTRGHFGSQLARKRAALARTKFLLSALERSYGLAAAATVPQVPNEPAVDALTKWESMDGEESSAFYKANRDAIIAAQSARQQSNWK